MNESFIKSPLNYIGGRYKILSQMVPLFPKDINCFVDLFAG
ncbi:MAG: DNA adenine methylase [Endomicrobium sp.]|nr:DNA adenine methylase [Endomicrobium sp.]